MSEELETIKVDVCVIGAGLSGILMTKTLLLQGYDVALIERDTFGGRYLSSGCMHIEAVRAIISENQTNIKRAAQDESADLSLCKVIKNFEEVSKAISQRLQSIAPYYSKESIEGLGGKVFYGAASALLDHEVLVEGVRIEFTHGVLACGAKMYAPYMKDFSAPFLLSDQDIFQLRQRPDHLAIIGYSADALAWAQIYKVLGCDVSMILDHEFLKNSDTEIAQEFYSILEKQGVRIIQSAKITEIEKDFKPVVHMQQDGSQRRLTASHLWFVGNEVPNILGLFDNNDQIISDVDDLAVNRHFKMKDQAFYLIGSAANALKSNDLQQNSDCLSSKDYEYQINCVMADIQKQSAPKPFFDSGIIRTSPEYGHIGWSLKKAVQYFGADKLDLIDWRYQDYALAKVRDQTDGRLKILCDKKGIVLGAEILGAGVSEMIDFLALVLSRNLSLYEVASLQKSSNSYSAMCIEAAQSYTALTKNTPRRSRWFSFWR